MPFSFTMVQWHQTAKLAAKLAALCLGEPDPPLNLAGHPATGHIPFPNTNSRHWFRLTITIIFYFPKKRLFSFRFKVNVNHHPTCKSDAQYVLRTLFLNCFCQELLHVQEILFISISLQCQKCKLVSWLKFNFYTPMFFVYFILKYVYTVLHKFDDLSWV